MCNWDHILYSKRNPIGQIWFLIGCSWNALCTFHWKVYFWTFKWWRNAQKCKRTAGVIINAFFFFLTKFYEYMFDDTETYHRITRFTWYEEGSKYFRLSLRSNSLSYHSYIDLQPSHIKSHLVLVFLHYLQGFSIGEGSTVPECNTDLPEFTRSDPK